MRGYTATTVHYIQRGNRNLKSGLLAIEHFTGSHTGERISPAFEAVVDSYDIPHKIHHIVTDNAANMGKAFTVCFPQLENMWSSDDRSAQDMLDVDEPEDWNDIPTDEISTVYSALDAASRKERLSCYCQSLHLTINDGLKDTKCPSTAILKASKLSSSLHHSQVFRDELEKEFGSNKGIPAAVCTRWNSTLRQLHAVVGLRPKNVVICT